MECNQSFTDYLVQCPEGIDVNLVADAPPYSALRWLIIDKFGNQYTGDVITNGNSGFTIPVSDLPAGLLTSYSGDFSLSVLDTDHGNKVVPILVAGYYDSIRFYVERGTRIKNNLGELVECGTSEAAGESEFFEGTGAQTVFVMTGLAVPGQEEVHVGGLLYSASTDYTLSGNNLTFTTAPEDGVEIRIDY